jgi:hypothetical protein
MRVGFIALALALGGCQYIEYPTAGPDAGNPNRMAYVGQPGSQYDPAANPPRDVGQVTYNPDAPLANLPADETVPPPPAASAISTAPLTPVPGTTRLPR